MLEPFEVTIETLAGKSKSYLLSKFPAVAGREIFASYPLSAIPKLAEYKSNEEVMFKLMAYVGVVTGKDTAGNDTILMLKTEALINNHVPDWQTLAKLEFEMMKYNSSFFREGVALASFESFAEKALVSVTPTLTRLLGRLSEAVKQRSKNLRTNTPSNKP